MPENTRWRPLLAAALVLCTGLLASCDDDYGDGEGGECQPCRSSTPRCDSGMSCSIFDGPFGKDHELCAKPSTDECTIP